jgi:universal bacterial protein YeaZ
MLILAIDTTALTASAAVTDDEKLIGLYTLNTSLTHSETMLPMVENLLHNSKISIKDIDKFACSAGPGSFTGVRIGISVIKGLAFGKDKPCVGVSTLEALAYNLNGFDGIICPVMDARRSQVYNALFRNGERLCEDRLITVDELYEDIKKYDEKIYYTGDGYKLIHYNETITPEILKYQNAYSVAQCASKEKCVTDIELSPVYLRASQAERELKEKN